MVLVHTANGALVDTSNMETGFGGKGWAMVIFHREHGIFVASHRVDHFHHSSILAGQPVDFAGELVVRKGMIKKIINKSGHYKVGCDQH